MNPAPEKTTPLASSRKRRTSALSLKKIHNKLTDIDYVASDADLDNKPKDKFTEVQLIEYWKQFGKQLQAEGELNMSSIININTPVLKEDGIVFTLPSKLMEEQFGGVKAKLMHHLRASLNNYSIQVKTVVLESQKKKYVYTPQEKFKKLADANPDLILLKNTFGLDI